MRHGIGSVGILCGFSGEGDPSMEGTSNFHSITCPKCAASEEFRAWQTTQRQKLHRMKTPDPAKGVL